MRIYTDASTRTAQGISGVAFIITDDKHREIGKHATVVKENDNNTAELRAICYALAFCKNKGKKAVLFTDSTYAINAIRGGFYRPQEEKLLQYIHEHLEVLNCKIFWLKGHCQDGTVLSHFNKRADKAAKRVREEYEKSLKIKKLLLAKSRRQR